MNKNIEKKSNTLIRQASILAGAGLVVRFLGFLYRLPLTAMLGDEGNGYYGAGFTIYMFFLILSSAGLPAAISKMVSERLVLNKHKEAHRIFVVAMYFAIVMGFVSMLTLWFGADTLEQMTGIIGSKYAIMTLAPTVLIVSIMAVYRGYFQGMKTTTPTAISQLIEQIFNASFSLICAYLLLDYKVSVTAAGGTMGTGIGAFFGLLTLLYIYKIKKPFINKRIKRDMQKVMSDKKLIKELMYITIPIITGTAIFSITNIIDMKMVYSRLMYSGVYTSQEATALYGQLNGKYVVITTLPISIATALATVSIPNIADLIVSKKTTEVNEKINFVIKLTMVLCIPAAVGIGVLGSQILLFLYPTHPDGGILLTVGSISIVFLALSQILTGVLQGTGKVYIPVVAAFLGAIVKIPINYYLIPIPKINVVGAIISTIFCYVVASLVNFIALKKTTKVKIYYTDTFFKPLFSSALMGLGVYATYYLTYYPFGSNTFSLFTSIGVGICIYFIILILINGISKDELNAIPMGHRISKYL